MKKIVLLITLLFMIVVPVNALEIDYSKLEEETLEIHNSDIEQLDRIINDYVKNCGINIGYEIEEYSEEYPEIITLKFEDETTHQISINYIDEKIDEDNEIPEEESEVVEEIENEYQSEPNTNNIDTYGSVSYRTHIESIGWETSFKKDGEISGTTGQSKRIEAIEIIIDSNVSGGIEYRTHIQNIGWESSFKTDGEISGTTGQSKRIEAIEIQLYGELKELYDIYYRVHAQRIGWMNWAKNGEKAGTAGYSYRVEAIEIILVEKGQPVELDTNGINTEESFRQRKLSIQAHVESIGWQETKIEEETVGTTGQSKRMEAISIFIDNQGFNGNIIYRSHVQNYGWLDWKQNGEISGTTGQSKRMEAIEINLTDELANYYDIYYRVHAQNFGWMSWAKNGETAGSTHLSCRLEAIEIIVLEKGKEPPIRTDTKTEKAYIEGEGWQIINGQTYYVYSDGTKAQYISSINGKRYEFSANGELQHEDIKLVIDVSSHNLTIDWDSLWNSKEIDGVIVRIAAGAESVDSQFEYNMAAINRLNIPYGFYIYSYAENYEEGKVYANFVKNVARNYLDGATLGVYLDLESNGITQYLPTATYEDIVRGFMEEIPTANIYTYTDYSNTVLNTPYLKSLTTWIANYAVTDCPGVYRGWQYTSKGTATGISTKVDFSIFYY